MKKILTRVLAMTLVLMTLFALCSAAFADTISKTAGANGDHKYTFWVKTDGSGTHKLKMTMTQGTIKGSGYLGLSKTWGKTYDGYYVRISYWDDANGKWVVEEDRDAFGTKSGYTYTLNRHNEYYKIYVDTWTPKTVLRLRIERGDLKWPNGMWGTFDTTFNSFTYTWVTKPKWTITSTDCDIYTSPQTP